MHKGQVNFGELLLHTLVQGAAPEPKNEPLMSTHCLSGRSSTLGGGVDWPEE